MGNFGGIGGFADVTSRFTEPITPNDSTDIKVGCLGLHNATATGGFVKVNYINGKTDTLWIAAGGFTPQLHITRVWATTTTITTVVGLFA